MLSKILKLMLIVILLPLFVTCGFMTAGSFMVGVSDGYEQAKEQGENGE